MRGPAGAEVRGVEEVCAGLGLPMQEKDGRLLTVPGGDGC